jgi:hypothetical protein
MSRRTYKKENMTTIYYVSALRDGKYCDDVVVDSIEEAFNLSMSLESLGHSGRILPQPSREVPFELRWGQSPLTASSEQQVAEIPLAAAPPPTAGGRDCSEVQQPADGILVKKPGYDILSVDNAAKQMMGHLGAALVKMHDAPCSAEAHVEQAVRLLARVTAYAYVPDDAEVAQAIKDAIAQRDDVLLATQLAAVGPLNVNTFVRFKMKPRGVEIAQAYWSSFFEFPNALFPVDQPDVECRVQFHDLFRIFGGEHMQHHFDGSPIYDLIIEPMP